MKVRYAFAALSLAVVALAAAQQDTQKGAENDAPPIAGSIHLGTSVEETRAVAVGYRASKLLGAKVYNDKNENIGKIGDLVVKPDGTLSLAVVDVGGFLGVGRHQVAIPVEQFAAVAPKVVLPGATKEALKQLPQFEYAKS
jgi:sporulation protein YlmC with PRC-barrel domain